MITRYLNLSKELGKKSSGLIFGARGVGKTRLCQHFLEILQSDGTPVLNYDLLHNETYERLLKHPHLFRLEVEKQIQKTNSLLVFVDEVQKVPHLPPP